MNRFKAEVGQRHLFSACEGNEHVRVEVPGGVERPPPFTDDVPWMQHGRGKRLLGALSEEIRLDRRLPDAVVSEGVAWLRFLNRCRYGVAVYKNRAAMQEVLNLVTYGIDQLCS